MEKLLITRKEAATALSISVDSLDKLRKEGRLHTVEIGSRAYYSPEELRAFVTKEGSVC